MINLIGNTPLIELKRVVPPGSARVIVKLESHNPTGSMKDRMALGVVEAAVASGRLREGGTVVEYTGGSTGTSLAFVCAARGYRAILVSSDAFSREKRDHMRALGAVVVEVPADGGGITRELIESMMARALDLSEAPGAFYTDQFNNHHGIDGYRPLGDEAWLQSGERIDVFVHSVGTSHSIEGVGQALRAHDSDLRVVAVEPAESPVLSGGASGSHRIEGMGAGFVPPLWRDDLAGAIEAVSTDDAMTMSRRLAREEGIFGGASSGANVVAALREAARIGPAGTVFTIICDSGMKYLSTELYSSSEPSLPEE